MHATTCDLHEYWKNFAVSLAHKFNGSTCNVKSETISLRSGIRGLSQNCCYWHFPFNCLSIVQGRTLGICMSIDNCRLFVGGIPKKVNKEDIRCEMEKVTEGVVDIIVYPSASDKSKNRG